MSQVILILNSGSSSLKFALYRTGGTLADTARDRFLHGAIEETGSGSRFHAVDRAGRILGEWESPEHVTESARPPRGVRSHAVGPLLKWLEDHLGGEKLAAVGHRVVHGGDHYQAPVVITSQVLADLDALTPLAPLHQPASLAPVRALMSQRPALLQVACFDTAFHHTMPAVARRLPLPRCYGEAGIHRFGFHGLSYAYIAQWLERTHPDLVTGRVIIAHLGNGASLCAMRNGQAIETTMGLTALDGLMMGTRTGQIDPGALLYMLQNEERTVAEVSDILYLESGLLGVSGVSSDMRVLRNAPPNEAIREALELYAYRIVQEIGALAAVLGGVDALVFTAGIGENDAVLRADVCGAFGWLGVQLDAGRNGTGASVISAATSAVRVLVQPTDEGVMICRGVQSCLGQDETSGG